MKLFTQLFQLLLFFNIQKSQLTILDSVSLQQEFELIHFIERQYIGLVRQAVKFIFLCQFFILHIRYECFFGLNI